jgi:pantoate kinase
MTAIEVIQEIRRLPRAEQLKVAEFARQVAENRSLSPEELGELAERMVKANDPAEADRLQREIVRGFYGGESHA